MSRNANPDSIWQKEREMATHSKLDNDSKKGVIIFCARSLDKKAAITKKITRAKCGLNERVIYFCWSSV